MQKPLAGGRAACICSTAEIAGSNSAGSMDVYLLALCCVGTGLCDGPITCPGKSYRVCVSLCVIKFSNNPLNLQWVR